MRTTVSLARALVDECHLFVEPEGLRLRAMDPATVAAVDVTLEDTAFDAYEADSMHLAVDLERLGDVVGMADRGQSVRLALDPETRTLEIRVGELAYTLALVDPETVRSPPDRDSLGVEFPAALTTESGTLARAVRAADMVSDHVALGVDDEAGAFYAEADGDTDDVSLSVPETDLRDLSPAPAHSLFSVDYLDAITRAIPGELDVDLELGTEKPLAVAFEYADGGGSAEYLLSPRISRT